MKEKKAISTKLLLLIIMSIIGVVYADSMVVSGEKLDNVYIGETSTYYIVKNPKDGSFQTISKKRMDIRKPIQSDDRKELLKQWEAKRAEPKDNKEKLETKVLSGRGDPVAAKKACQLFLLNKQPPLEPVKKKSIKVGSTMADVLEVLGEPKGKGPKTVTSYGVSEYWKYENGNIYFDNGKIDFFTLDREKQE